MPYTPPAQQQSPASSKSASPVISRSSSISDELPRSPVTGRPQLPRSHSSASYMNRQRRSPSIPKADGPPTPTESNGRGVHASDFAARNSVRQSPSPVNANMMPTGAGISLAPSFPRPTPTIPTTARARSEAVNSKLQSFKRLSDRSTYEERDRRTRSASVST